MSVLEGPKVSSQASQEANNQDNLDNQDSQEASSQVIQVVSSQASPEANNQDNQEVSSQVSREDSSLAGRLVAIRLVVVRREARVGLEELEVPEALVALVAPVESFLGNQEASSQAIQVGSSQVSPEVSSQASPVVSLLVGLLVSPRDIHLEVVSLVAVDLLVSLQVSLQDIHLEEASQEGVNQEGVNQVATRPVVVRGALEVLEVLEAREVQEDLAVIHPGVVSQVVVLERLVEVVAAAEVHQEDQPVYAHASAVGLVFPEARFQEVRVLEVMVLEVMVLEVRVLEVRVLEVRVLEVRVLEVMVLEVRVLEVKALVEKAPAGMDGENKIGKIMDTIKLNQLIHPLGQAQPLLNRMRKTPRRHLTNLGTGIK